MRRLWTWFLKDSNPVSFALQVVSLTCFIIAIVVGIQANMVEATQRSSVSTSLWGAAGLVVFALSQILRALVNRVREEKENHEP